MHGVAAGAAVGICVGDAVGAAVGGAVGAEVGTGPGDPNERPPDDVALGAPVGVATGATALGVATGADTFGAAIGATALGVALGATVEDACTSGVGVGEVVCPAFGNGVDTRDVALGVGELCALVFGVTVVPARLNV